MPRSPPLMLELLLLLLLITNVLASWDIDVVVTTEASGAIGGEAFVIQPTVEIRNLKGVLQTSISGTVSAELMESPSGYEFLRRQGVQDGTADNDGGNGGGNDDDDDLDGNTSHLAEVVTGVATFAGLYINEAGQDYRLRYIFRDEHGLTLGHADAATTLDVMVGEPYQIDVTASPGRAYGGALFGDMPAVGVKDRGGNHLTNVNIGQVAVELVDDDGGTPSSLLLHADEGTGPTVQIENGLAIFDGLYMNEARLYNRLRFETNLPLAGPTVCESNDFAVGVGPAHELIIDLDASHSTVSGGRPFPHQPRIKVVDAGGNKLDYDYSSAIRVEIYSNPSNGKLSSLGGLDIDRNGNDDGGVLAPVIEGVTQFDDLTIDRAGIGYRLLYSLLKPNQYKTALVPSDIEILGDYFDVDVGSPHALEILQEPTSTWGGNQPFATQPRVAIVDAGGNIVSTGIGSTWTVEAYLTSSLAVSYLPTPTSPLAIETREYASETENSPDATASLPTSDLIVSSLSDDGIYAPGDIIQIAVDFPELVIVDGEPYLALNVGRTTSDAAFAVFVQGSGTTRLVFEYTVGLDQTSFDLDYLDIYSLKLDRYRDGTPKCSIRYVDRESTVVDAGLVLPPPGSAGSLSDTSNIVVDSRIPHIVSLMGPIDPGDHDAEDAISIFVEFSIDVVVTGSPYLLLETGDIDKRAEFMTQVGPTVLEFQYTVELGDDLTNLDYWTDEGVFRSSAASFQLNGGSITRKSASPILPADLHLNPAQGYLDGKTLVIAEEGVATFADLKIGRRGNDYKLRFRTSSFVQGVDLEATMLSPLSVGPSTEYEIMGEPNDRNLNDRFGASVAIDDNVLAVGAPGKRLPLPEIQVLTISAQSIEVENEIQIIETAVNATEATKRMYRFASCADSGEGLQGTFTIVIRRDDYDYEYGQALVVSSSIGPAELETQLMGAFPVLGRIFVERTTNADCPDVTNSWRWDVTIVDASTLDGTHLEVNGDGGLGRDGGTMTDAIIVQDTAMLEGSFRLVNPSNQLQSRPIFFDASDIDIKEAIETDLGLAVQNVLVIDTDDYGRELPSLGRRWKITFSHYPGAYGDADVNVPNLDVIGDNLTGFDANVWTHTAFEGRSPLRGHFSLSLRDSPFSAFLTHDASASSLKLALESLDSINTVSVSPRRNLEADARAVSVSGSSWSITFHSVNRQTDYGWVSDPGAESNEGNLPPLDVKSHLIGWNVSHTVDHVHGSDANDTQAQWMEKRIGDTGHDSGAVSIFSRVDEEQWGRESTIVAPDHTSMDRFGHSVDLKSSFLAVGAPSKTIYGLPEQQALSCDSLVDDNMSGTFTVSFRGFTSDLIAHDASPQDIEEAIVGLYGESTNIHPLPRIAVEAVGDDWDSGFCGGGGVSGVDNAILITFLTPSDGDGISTEWESVNGDIELMAVDISKLIGASVSISEKRKGSLLSPIASGTVYLFERISSTRLTSAEDAGEYRDDQFSWNQVAKLTPLDGLDGPTNSAQFGWSVSLHVPAFTEKEESARIIAIGSPGYADESGKVYLFSSSAVDPNNENGWKFLGTLTNQLWKPTPSPGDRFGEAIMLQGDTILVGAPGHDHGKGAVYVFRQGRADGAFLPSQEISLDDISMFGQSLSMSEDVAVICSPGQQDDTGACHVYNREDSLHPFVHAQQLEASNLQPGDRFGHSVAINGPRIVVGQLQHFDGSLNPPRPVQTMEVRCIVASCADIIGPVLHLSWREDDTGDELLTEKLPMNVSAIDLRSALEHDLNTGQVSVKRATLLEQHIDGGRGEGYRWRVTFDDDFWNKSMLRANRIIPRLSCHTREPKLTCIVSIDQGVPQNVRSKAHVFTRDGDSNRWTEQAYLHPEAPQRQDMVGSSVALDGKTAVVGAPNRETLNINSGSAMVNSLDFLGTVFDSPDGIVLEGEDFDVGFSRMIGDAKEQAEQMLVGIKSMDFMADRALELTEYTSADSIGIQPHGIAGGGVDTSLWVDGSYDFSGRSDYASLDELILLERGQTNGNVVFETTDDSVYELPDESTRLCFDLPGYVSSELGGLCTALRILDDGDATSNFDKLTLESTSDGTGAAQSIAQAGGTLIVGRLGKADIYRKEGGDGGWKATTSLQPPSSDSFMFVESVAISEDAAIVGDFGRAKAFVYTKDSNSWRLSKSLLPFGLDGFAVTQEHGFATSTSINGAVLAVGCPGLETVFLYRKEYDKELKRYEWKNWQLLRSSEYGFDEQMTDAGDTIQRLHQRAFGTAVTVDRRTVGISAPLSEHFRQIDPGIREKVFVFSSAPHIQQITLRCDEIPRSGSFRLQLSNHPIGSSAVGMSGRIPHDATADQMKMALEEMVNVGEVEVTFSSTYDGLRQDKHHFTWKVAFVDIFSDTVPLIEPLWDDPLVLSVASTFEPKIDVKTYATQGEFIERQALQGPPDSNHGGFGRAVSLSGSSLLIGAPFSGGKSRTTWDFEKGDLTGWKSSGTIASKQPVFGGDSKVPNLQGRYLIATHDDQVETLTSDPFSILGDEISLLIGGGCDHLGTYSELIVDSYPVLRATGSCREEMDRVVWGVTDYKGRAGQIRIVDASKSEHINVDDIQFSWDRPIEVDESPNAGAAFIFTRNCRGSKPYIDSDTCTWILQERMVSSDKRSGNLFGDSVAIDDEKGFAIVGSANSPLYDDYHETPVMPGAHRSVNSDNISEDLEDYLRSGNTLSAIGGSLRLIDHLVAENRTKDGEHADDEAVRNQQLAKGAGAVYVYNRKFDDKTGAAHWNVVEDARITPPDVKSGDGFGAAVSIDGIGAAIGARGAHQGNGAAFLFDLATTSIRFRQTEYSVTERDTKVKIFLERDERYAHRVSTIGYSTSDLTARGVDTAKYQKCIRLEHRLREDCGDYEQTSGTVTFPIGVSEVYFTIGIVNDDVREPNLEYAQILLHIPGGGPLQGEQYRAKLRIDDK